MSSLVYFVRKTEEHDDVIKWKHFPRYWPFVRGIHRSTVNSLHKGQWRGALMFSLMCARINGWVNNREAGDLRRYRHHYDVIVMEYPGIERVLIFHEEVFQLSWSTNDENAGMSSLWRHVSVTASQITNILTVFSTSRPRQNNSHFPDDIFKCPFFNANVWIPLKISPKFVPEVRINRNIPTLVQITSVNKRGTKWRIHASVNFSSSIRPDNSSWLIPRCVTA